MKSEDYSACMAYDEDNERFSVVTCELMCDDDAPDGYAYFTHEYLWLPEAAEFADIDDLPVYWGYKSAKECMYDVVPLDSRKCIDVPYDIACHIVSVSYDAH